MIARKIALTAAWTAASATKKIAEVTMLAAGGNTEVAYILSDDGTEGVPIPKGVPFPLTGVDLSEVYFRGLPGDSVILIGF